MTQRKRSSDNLHTSSTAADLAALDGFATGFLPRGARRYSRDRPGGREERRADLGIARAFLDRTGRALLTRLRPETMTRLAEEFTGCVVDTREVARAAVIYTPEYERPDTGGKIASSPPAPAMRLGSGPHVAGQTRTLRVRPRTCARRSDGLAGLLQLPFPGPSGVFGRLGPGGLRSCGCWSRHSSPAAAMSGFMPTHMEQPAFSIRSLRP